MDEPQWTSVQLGDVADVIMGQAPLGETVNETGDGLPFLQGNAEFGDPHPTAHLVCRRPPRWCEAGDILVSVRAPVGALNLANRTYAIGRGLAAVRFKNIEPSYGRYALNREVIQLRRLAQGSTFEAVGRTELAKLTISSPVSRREQRRITEVIGSVDDQIGTTDRLLRKELRLKEGLLRRLSSAYFSGENLTSLANISHLITSGSRGWAEHYSDSGALFVRIGNLTREHINLRLDDCVFVQVPKGSEGRRTALHPGDVMISITADLGIIGVFPDGLGEAYVNQHIALVRVGHLANSRWVGHMLSSDQAQRQFQVANDAGAKAGLNLPTIGRIEVPLPERSTQDRVTAVLDKQDLQIRHVRSLLNKLQLLKRGIMEDLLTGRVRVPAEDDEHVR